MKVFRSVHILFDWGLTKTDTIIVVIEGKLRAQKQLDTIAGDYYSSSRKGAA
jgi:hypothetical protein